eukprot:15249371-Ditylum_brightwellii.AAC.1
MADCSFAVALAILTRSARVAAVTVIVASCGKGLHYVIAFIAAAVDIKRTKFIEGINSYLFSLLFFLGLL